MQQQLSAEGWELFRRLIGLPDEVKNQPAPAELQDAFVRWRKKFTATKPTPTHALLDTQEPYVKKLTVRLLSYNLELLLKAGQNQ